MWFQEFPGEKKPIFFPCGAFLSCVVDEIFIDVPWFRENSPALKNSWLRACKGGTEYKLTKNPLWKIKVLGVVFGILHYVFLHYFLYLLFVLAQIHSHIFNLTHRMRIKISTLKTEELLFSKQYEIVQYEIRKD